jgi:hypothetical protein
MSYRTPFITSFVYDLEEARTVYTVLSTFGLTAFHGAHVVHGICKHGAPGHVSRELKDVLQAALAEAEVQPGLSVAFVGEHQVDQVVFLWDGQQLTS